MAAAAVGALLGSKALCWVQHPALTWAHRGDLLFLASGQSVVGGLLGGLASVEWTKRLRNVRVPTGDLFAAPLCLAIAVGRVGCFLTGLPDGTHGVPTSLPWGVDFGDGIPRHPAQLYEIAFVLPVGAWSLRRVAGGVRDGSVFRGFLVAYLAFRFALEFIKPEPRIYAGLSGIQAACLAGIGVYAWGALRDG